MSATVDARIRPVAVGQISLERFHHATGTAAALHGVVHRRVTRRMDTCTNTILRLHYFYVSALVLALPFRPTLAKFFSTFCRQFSASLLLRFFPHFPISPFPQLFLNDSTILFTELEPVIEYHIRMADCRF